mgnify:CR=1 FL=1
MNVTRIWFAGYINDGTAAGINALRRLKIKRCGELALRLSSRLTFAYFSVVVRANHLTVDTLPQILVGMVPRAGPLISAAPDSQGIATHICIGILTVR